MRVCFVTTAFPRWAGDGQAAFVWEAVRAVARQGVQAEGIAMHSPGVATSEYMEGIRITRQTYWWPERGELLRREGAAGQIRINPNGVDASHSALWMRQWDMLVLHIWGALYILGYSRLVQMGAHAWYLYPVLLIALTFGCHGGGVVYNLIVGALASRWLRIPPHRMWFSDAAGNQSSHRLESLSSCESS